MTTNPHHKTGPMPLSDPLHPLWKSENLRRAIHAAGVALWSWNVTDDRFAMDEHGFQLWGLEKSGEVKFEDLSAHIHPADRDRVRAAFTATRGIVGSYEIDFRIIVEDEIRWISARGIGDDTALHDGQMFGVFLDVTGRKQAEEGHELLAGEMSHREATATALALIIHELATNSLKYGALSVDTGILDLSGSMDGDDLMLVWTERGGPHVERPDGAEGYGSKLGRRSIARQLGGSIDYDWSANGVIVVLRLKAERLAT